MKKVIFLLTTCVTLVLGFQNCSSEHDALSAVTTFNLGSMYPYQSAQPTYFEDVQIVGKDKDGSQWNYSFVASIVNIDDEDEDVSVSLIVKNPSDESICSKTKVVDSGSNHIEITDCKSADYSQLKVEVQVKNSSDVFETIRVHEFNL